uniref:Uncharacterized protein n=1 Tax=Cacopsylla melanoneura TaxID=428564 RepID=A0A8D8Z952_9HEMI
MILEKEELKQIIDDAIKSALDIGLKELKEIVQKQQKQIQDLSEKNAGLTKQLDDVSRRMDDTEQYMRRPNVQINNVPEHPDERMEEIICKMGDKVGVKINFAVDIQAAHRIPSAKSPRPIIVKFSNRQMKKNFIIQTRKAKLKCDCLNLPTPSTNPIYVNDHLTKTRSNIMFEARNLVRKKMIKSAWTVEGNIWIKRDDMSAPVRISAMNDLKTFQTSYASSTNRT